MTRHEDSNAEQGDRIFGTHTEGENSKTTVIKTTGTMYEIRARKEAWPARIGLVNPPE